MFLGAIVFLPQGWDSHPNARYPVLVHHGHFPKDAASDGWRETPPDASAQGTVRDNQIAALYRYNQARADLAHSVGQMEELYAK